MANPIKLEVYLDENGEAEGTLYIDDGETYEYETHDAYAKVKFTFKDNVLTSEREAGSFTFGEA